MRHALSLLFATLLLAPLGGCTKAAPPAPAAAPGAEAAADTSPSPAEPEAAAQPSSEDEAAPAAAEGPEEAGAGAVAEDAPEDDEGCPGSGRRYERVYSDAHMAKVKGQSVQEIRAHFANGCEALTVEVKRKGDPHTYSWTGDYIGEADLFVADMDQGSAKVRHGSHKGAPAIFLTWPSELSLVDLTSEREEEEGPYFERSISLVGGSDDDNFRLSPAP